MFFELTTWGSPVKPINRNKIFETCTKIAEIWYNTNGHHRGKSAREDITMDKKRIASTLLIVGAVLIIAPMFLNHGEELSGLLKSSTILGAGCEIFAAIFYMKSKKDDEE